MNNEKTFNCKFRYDPVPYCGRYHKYYNYFRQPKLGMVKRYNCNYGNVNGRYGFDDEDSFFVTKYKDAHLPVWDDRPKHIDRSWKTSFKVKRQWMKKLYMRK